jgi:hypothetical protein
MLVSVDKLKPGMVLAENVRNHQSMLLLEAGKKISARAIRIFKSWGITHVTVRSRNKSPESASAADAAVTVADIESKLKKKFAETLEDPVMVTIMEAAGRVLSRQIEKEEARSADSA